MAEITTERLEWLRTNVQHGIMVGTGRDQTIVTVKDMAERIADLEAENARLRNRLEAAHRLLGQVPAEVFFGNDA